MSCKTYVVGDQKNSFNVHSKHAQKNRFNEAVLLCTQNMF